MADLRKILITDIFSAAAEARLKSSVSHEVVRSASTLPTTEELRNAEVLIIRSKHFWDASLLELAPNLRLIVTSTSGFDHIDFKACKERNIRVAFTPRANVESAAQTTLLIMMSLLRKFPQALQTVRSHSWKNSQLLSQELGGQQVGIIGYGRVGRRVRELLRPFDCQVIAHDPYADPKVFQQDNVEPLGLTEVLVQSDILSLHVPLTCKTKHLINEHTLPFLNEGAYLVNASRGPVINELELVLALERNQLAGAALDVFEDEPLPQKSRLRKLNNVVLSPHIGGWTTQSYERASMMAVDQIIQFLETGALEDELPPKQAWYDETF
jgi:phosphoglycerate dehydrogenase-like enzyme